MKTPMQEMLEYVQDEVQLFGSARQILISKIKEMLEKEKEFMQKVYANAKVTGEMDEVVRTFNTKEK